MLEYMPINPDYNDNPEPYLDPNPTGPFAAFRRKYPYSELTDDALYARWERAYDDDDEVVFVVR